MKKKFLSSVVVITVFSCLTFPAFAMYGRVIANSTMDVGGGVIMDTSIDGTGSAEEVIADKDDVMNIYAKTVIVDPDDYILAQDETTEHYVRQAYNSCSTSLKRSDLKLGVYSVSTFAATRYTDNTTNNDVDIVGQEIVIATKSAEPKQNVDNTDDEYVHLSLYDLSNNNAILKNSLSSIPQKTILEVYGQHLSQAGVGDKIPQIYVKPDGNSLYIVDETLTDGVMKTYYIIDGGVATKVK